MFPTGLLAATQARLTTASTSTADIWRNFRSLSTSGGVSDDWRRVATASPGRLTSAAGMETVQGGGMVAQVTNTWHCEAGIDIRAHDQLVVSGHTYDVSGPADADRTDVMIQHIPVILSAFRGKP